MGAREVKNPMDDASGAQLWKLNQLGLLAIADEQRRKLQKGECSQAIDRGLHPEREAVA